MKKILAAITDEAYEALRQFKEENGFVNIDTALGHAPRPEGRGLPQASLCVTRRRGKCEKKRMRNPRSS